MSALRETARLQAGEGRRLALSVALAAGATGAAVALLATSGYLISRAAQRPQVIALTVTIVAIRSFGIARSALRYAERLASHELTLRQLARLRATFFDRLAPLIPGRLEREGRGELLTRFVADVDTIADLYLRVLIPALVALVVIVCAAAAGTLMLGAIGVVLAVALTADAVTSSWLADRVGALSARRQAPVRAQLSDRLVEAIDGSAELAVAGQAPATVTRIAGIDRQLARLARRDAGAGALAGCAHALLSGAGLLAVLIVGIDGVHHHALSGVLLAAAVFLFFGAREGIAPLPRAAQRARVCATAADRLQQICAREAPVRDPLAPRSPRGGGSLEACAVTARYGPGGDTVLEGVSLSLAPAEHVALIGPSGSGKTTLAELLVRFRDVDAGAITLDGADVRHLSQDDLRAAVLLCGQDARLFNTSLRQNLLIADPQAAEAALWAALAAVELDGWAAALPDGLDTSVGQYGELVSGGQRRRIALARALLSPARFLILDEPTAHLDAPLAARVLRQVLDAAGDRGVLVITHDVASIGCCDRVLALSGGRLDDVSVTPPPLKGARS